MAQTLLLLVVLCLLSLVVLDDAPLVSHASLLGQ
jgi:hypothetical protein